MKKYKTTKILSLLAAVIFLASGVQYVLATSAESASGWAWGGNDADNLPNTGDENGIGWISFNDLDCDTDGDGLIDNASCGAVGNPIGAYGVDIPGSGDLSGYAWSEHYGWISFDGADLAGCVPLLGQATRTGINITGGARILSICDGNNDGDCADGGVDNLFTNTGGFDGCISLTGVATDGSPYGVSVIGAASDTLDGYAWSSDLGWINFGGNGGNVSLTSVGPNLTSTLAPTVTGTLTKDQNVIFNGQVRNSGGIDITTDFADNFTYCWGAACSPATMIGGHINKTAPLAVGATLNDTSDSFTLTNSGVLRVQHCVDSVTPPATGQILEATETLADNCQIADFTVTANPAVDLSISICTILAGANECISPLTAWNFSDATPDYLIKLINNNTTGDTIYSGANGNSSVGGTRLVQGPNTLYGYHNNDFADGQHIGSLTFNVGCASGAQWSVGTGFCELPPSFTVSANPRLIRSGDTTEISVTITSANPITCEILNATTNTPDHITHDGTISPNTYTISPTKPIKNKQIVTVNCNDGVTGLTASGEAIVEVVPKIQEI